MPFRPRAREKQVRLTVFNSEPLARLAEQRLRQEDIPCVISSLHGGPGLWGSAYNLPHALFVFESHEMRARDVLDLVPMELAEREGSASSRRDTTVSLRLILIIVAVLLTVIITAPTVSLLLG